MLHDGRIVGDFVREDTTMTRTTEIKWARRVYVAALLGLSASLIGSIVFEGMDLGRWSISAAFYAAFLICLDRRLERIGGWR